MPINKRKIENKERYITIKFQTKQPWSALDTEIDEFLHKVTDDQAISEVKEFNSLGEQLKDKDFQPKSTAEIVANK